MAIEKKQLKSKPVCKVTFKVDRPDANSVEVVGDFNDWKPGATELKKLKSGEFKGTVDLDKDNAYEFKYVVDGVYENEPDADAQVWNDFAGSENSVIEA